MLSDPHGAKKPLLTNTLHIVVYSFAFGFFQGSVLPNGEAMLIAFDPSAIIGAGLAGGIALLVYYHFKGKRAPQVLRRLSLFTFVAGIMLTVYPWPATQIIACITVMMGFIIVDIESLVFVVRLVRSYDINAAFAVGFNRAAEYATFAISVALGAFLTGRFGGIDVYPLIVSGIATFAVLGYTLASMGNEQLDWIEQLYSPVRSAQTPDTARRVETDNAKALSGEQSAEALTRGENASDAKAPAERESAYPTYGRFKTRCYAVCERAGLSPREIEVFMLMAKGRNAEYIQGALVISNYTARTHIANIYRKVGVHSLQELIDVVEKEEPEGSSRDSRNSCSAADAHANTEANESL